MTEATGEMTRASPLCDPRGGAWPPDRVAKPVLVAGDREAGSTIRTDHQAIAGALVADQLDQLRPGGKGSLDGPVGGEGLVIAEAGDLRNAIVDDRAYPAEIVADPRDGLIKRLRAVRENILRPRLLRGFGSEPAILVTSRVVV